MSAQQDTVYVEFFGSTTLYHDCPTDHSIAVSKPQLGRLCATPCPTCRGRID